MAAHEPIEAESKSGVSPFHPGFDVGPGLDECWNGPFLVSHGHMQNNGEISGHLEDPWPRDIFVHPVTKATYLVRQMR